jgi:hypothetical protein
MTKNGILKALVFLALLAGVSTGVFAQLTISGGFALSTMSAEVEGITLDKVEGGVGLGGNVYFDYLLPINIPLSLGAEIGADGSSITLGVLGSTWEDKVMALPLLLRAAYHFDLDPKLDLFLVGKIGYIIGFITDGDDKEFFDSSGGFGFGIDIGVAYYFTSLVGIFAEAGFDGYMLKTKLKDQGSEFTFDSPFYRFATLGLSFRK